MLAEASTSTHTPKPDTSPHTCQIRQLCIGDHGTRAWDQQNPVQKSCSHWCQRGALRGASSTLCATEEARTVMVDKGAHFISGSSLIPMKSSRLRWCGDVLQTALTVCCMRHVFSEQEPLLLTLMAPNDLWTAGFLLHAWAFAQCSFLHMHHLLAAGAPQQPDPDYSQSAHSYPPSPALLTDSAGSLIILLFRAGDTWPSNKSPRSLFKLGAASYVASVQTLLSMETFPCKFLLLNLLGFMCADSCF